MNKLSLPLLLISGILLIGCGGGGKNESQSNENVQDTSGTESNFFSKLDQGLPYFMDASEHDLLTLGTNLFVITASFTLGVGAEGDNCSTSGSFDRTETAKLEGTKIISDSQDIYNNCISSTDAYQNGIITTHSVQVGGESLSYNVQSENFVNTNFRSGDSEPMKSKLKNIKISETGIIHFKQEPASLITSIEELVYATENGDILKIKNYVHELYFPPSQSPISHIFKKSNYSASWIMKHDASHHKLLFTSPIPTVGDTHTLRALPDGLNYKLDVEITKELVYLKNDDSGSPASGSYKITLNTSNNTNNANGFNASTIILDTVFENGKATISRYVCVAAVLPHSCEEVNLPTQWEINLK